MLKKGILTISGILISIACYCQIDQLVVPQYTKLPGDSVQNKQLINSIEGFLKQTTKANKENSFVLKENLLETSALLDQIKGMENDGTAKRNFYKCYLTNVMLLDSSDYIIQLSYLGINGSTPVLRTSFKLIAKKVGDQYYFSSPLKRNTVTWQTKKVGNFIFYYKTSLNSASVNNYVKRAKEFDKKLHAPDYITQIYYSDDLQEAMELLGMEYKSDYNGASHGDLSSFEDNSNLQIIGSSDTDPTALDIHDLWHDRLHHTISLNIINRPVDEACAYLYGGSWGISWNDIFKKFKIYMGDNKDWLTAFNENKNFGPNQQYHLYVSYVINALIVQKIEKEKGFPAVIELLSCGKRESVNENYFRALDKIIGINKSNFNDNVEKLVQNEPVN